MENTHDNDHQTQNNPISEEQYHSRPAWQVWAARIGLVLFLLIVLIQILNIARGGL